MVTMPSKECKHPTCSGDTCRRPKKEKKRTYIKKVSDKRKGRLVIYKELRAVFMKSHPICEAALAGCTKTATDVHHMMGRENELLNMTCYWLAVCRSCHDKLTIDSKMAIEKGLSLSKHKKSVSQ